MTLIYLRYFVSASDVRVSMASVILEEGQMGNIFCVVKGIGSYYWRKGDFIDNSTKVASIVSGVPSAGDGSYSVNENGTLFIRSVVLEDEGKYFCRVASDATDCSGEVMIYVQGKSACSRYRSIDNIIYKKKHVQY